MTDLLRSTTASRTGAVVILLLALLLFWSAVASPILGWLQRSTQQRKELQIELARLNLLAARQPQLTETLAQLESDPFWGRLYSEAPSLALTSLQNDFRAVCLAQGVTIETMQPSAIEPSPQLTPIGFRFTASMTMDRLVALSEAVSRAEKLMAIGDLNVSSPGLQEDTDNPVLQVSGEVSGYTIGAAS